MSLLTIVQDAAKEIGLQIPNFVFASNQEEVKKLLRYAQKAGIKCLKSAEWQDLKTERTFTSVATEVQTGIIPADFDRLVSNTMWNRTDGYQITGSTPSNEWAELKGQGYSDTTQPKFIQRGGNIYITPTMTAGKTIAFEYVSKNFVLDSLGVAKASFTADTDTSIIDEELLKLGTIFEYLQNEGLPFQIAGNNYEDRRKLLLDNELPDYNYLSAGDIFNVSTNISI